MLGWSALSESLGGAETLLEVTFSGREAGEMSCAVAETTTHAR